MGRKWRKTGVLIEGGKNRCKRSKKSTEGREVQVWERDIYVSDFRGGAALNSEDNP